MRARENPFRSERLLSLRYRFNGTTWPELLSKCERLRFRGALVGPYGSGKTTLLEDLEIKLREHHLSTRMIRAPNDQTGLKRPFLTQLARPVQSGEIVLVDGAEQIGRWDWQRFKWRTRCAGGLIITTHKPGLLPTLWECSTTARLLQELAAGLLDCEPVELRDCSEILFRKHQGNLRAALREYYDLASANIPVAGQIHTDRSPGPAIVPL